MPPSPQHENEVSVDNKTISVSLSQRVLKTMRKDKELHIIRQDIAF